MVALRRPSTMRRNASVKARIAQTVSLPAPIGGWNVRDALATMPPSDAPILTNFFPGLSDCRVRKGYSQHVTGMPAVTETLAAYSTPAGTQTLFAVSNGEIYDVTSAGAVGAAAVTSLTNSRWQHVNYTITDGTSYLCMFNGVDSPRYWNGSAWTTITGVSTPAITGVTTSTLIHVAVHKRRMWLVEVDSLKAWYLPVDSVGGAAASLDLAGPTRLGGYLMAIGTFAIDAGDGIDDFWVGVTSEGECVVYQGTDPASVATWSIVGVWRIGEPIGRRCMTQFKGDLLINTTSGVVSVAAMMSNATPITVSDKIRDAHTDAVGLYKGNYGWQLHYFPAQDHLIVNVPNLEGSQQTQHVMNEKSGAWAKYDGLQANCWEIHNQNSYFGGVTSVNKFWDTFSDNATAIECEVQQAYSYFGAPGIVKRWSMARPNFLANGTPTVALNINSDFNDNVATSTVSFSAPAYAIWDQSLWDVGVWGGGLEARANWTTLNGAGIAGGIRMNIQTLNVEVKWASTDIVFEVGVGTV